MKQVGTQILWLALMISLGISLYVLAMPKSVATEPIDTSDSTINADTAQTNPDTPTTPTPAHHADSTRSAERTKKVGMMTGTQIKKVGKRTVKARVSDKVSPPPRNRPVSKPVIFLDIAKQDFLKDPFVGRVVIELYPHIAPKTVSNFQTLCYNKKYINTQFHRVVQGFMVQGGDIVNQDGTGIYSIYGGEGSTFKDENFALRHSEPGIISMANTGPDTNGSQFFIITQPAPHLDNKHVAFGKVIRGMEFVYDIEKEITDSHDRPIRRCYIMNSGAWNSKNDPSKEATSPQTKKGFTPTSVAPVS